MFTFEYTGSFKKNYKVIVKRRYDIGLLNDVLRLLAQNGTLPAKNKPHILSGTYAGFWECHVKPDWLLIYTIDEKNKIIKLYGTGTHADLFK